jgi:hypothetical protein
MRTELSDMEQGSNVLLEVANVLKINYLMHK